MYQYVAVLLWITYLNYWPPTLIITNITDTVDGYYKPFLLIDITNTISSSTLINIFY